MKRILAVSGGVDSMVLLHLFCAEPDVIVAHFNHGIRDNSDDDEAFVKRWAERYGLEFVAGHANLGADCSEEHARRARYNFLYGLADAMKAKILTAHHANDALESIAINLLRGTGWRGLAPLHNSRIERPLITMTKHDILRYAAEHQVVFREDQSNTDDKYLRNRIRQRLRQADDVKKQKLLALYQAQSCIYVEVEELLTELCPPMVRYSKDLLIVEPKLSSEILRRQLANHGLSLTRPQLQRAIAAIIALESGKKFSLNKNSFLKIGKYYYEIITIKSQSKTALPKAVKDVKLKKHGN